MLEARLASPIFTIVVRARAEDHLHVRCVQRDRLRVPTHLPDVPSPLPRRIKRVHVSIASPLMQPSPNGRRVGIRIVTFEMLWGRRWARWHHRHLKQLADGASHVRTQRLEQVPYFSGATIIAVIEMSQSSW